jgi:hypothetical protein
MRFAKLLAAALLAAPCAVLAATPYVAPTPSYPSYGKPMRLELRNADWPAFLPATRYVVSGNVITIDYEYLPDGWSATRPDFGYSTVDVGELPPGNYTVNYRLFDIGKPASAPQIVTTNVPVLPPDAWGVYSVPQNPNAFETMWATVRSAVFYDPASMRATVTGNVIRVDFDYYADAPTSGVPPAGSTSYGSVKVQGLAPGQYRFEAWGRPKTGGDSVRYFTRDVGVASTSPVIEYYADTTDHYFLTAGPSDISSLDPGTVTWKRSGQRFKAWLRASDAPPGAVPVCRFYAGGPNSHFYTGSSVDCEGLKELERKQRAEATAKGVNFLGWAYEQIAFYALVPVNGQCPGDTAPVYRAYNQRGIYNDSNHRFMVDSQMRNAELAGGWADEGVAFCSPL